jgi:hypothetical protein
MHLDVTDEGESPEMRRNASTEGERGYTRVYEPSTSGTDENNQRISTDGEDSRKRCLDRYHHFPDRRNDPTSKRVKRGC